MRDPFVEHRDGSLCKACHERQTEVTGTDHDLARNRPDDGNRLEVKIIEPFGKPAAGRRNLSTTRSNVSDFQNIDIFSKDVIDSDGKLCPSRMFAVTNTA